MKIEYFSREIKKSVEMFQKNMELVEAEDRSGPEWFDMFRRWLEIGTEMEEEYWPEE